MSYKEELLKKLEPFFIEKGFKLIKSRDLIEKKSKDFKFQVHFLFHYRSIETAIEVALSIEHVPTERIYRKATGFSSFGTIGNEIGKLITNDDGKIKSHHSFDIIVDNQNDFDYAIEKITFIIDEIAGDYFRDYGNLYIIDKVLNDNPKVISVHRNDQYYRFPLGLIVAKLSNRDNYYELEKIYDELINDMSEMYIERYNQVKKHLNSI